VSSVIFQFFTTDTTTVEVIRLYREKWSRKWSKWSCVYQHKVYPQNIKLYKTRTILQRKEITMPKTTTKLSKLEIKLEFLKNNPDQVYQPSKPIVPILCEVGGPEAPKECRYRCNGGCYMCEEDWEWDPEKARWRKIDTMITQSSYMTVIKPPKPKGYLLEYSIHAHQRMLERQISKKHIEAYFENDCRSDIIEVKYITVDMPASSSRPQTIKIITVYPRNCDRCIKRNMQ
jgi:hypothetical protein